MNNFDHQQLLDTITKIGNPPLNDEAFGEWIKAGSQLEFMRTNAKSDDTVIYAAGYNTFVHSLVVSNNRLFPLNHEDIMNWSGSPYDSIASYVTGGGSDMVRIERGLSGTGSTTLNGALQLVFGRTFEGWSGAERNYLEISQEYAQIIP